VQVAEQLKISSPHFSPVKSDAADRAKFVMAMSLRNDAIKSQIFGRSTLSALSSEDDFHPLFLFLSPPRLSAYFRVTHGIFTNRFTFGLPSALRRTRSRNPADRILLGFLLRHWAARVQPDG
jgi:hypothetical protein